MFKTERVPVTLYQSTDEGAPQLTAAAGSLKTILKACLVTGYGSKQPLGWESAFEDENYIAFRSKHNKASRCWLGIDNQYPRAAAVTGYHEMSAKGAGQKPFGEGLFKLLPKNRDTTEWLLVGHARGFCLLVRGGYSSVNGVSKILYFGDFHDAAPAGGRNCLLLKEADNLSGSKYVDTHEYGVGSQIFINSANYKVDKRYLALASSADAINHNVGGSTASVGRFVSGAKYPDFVTQGFSAFDIFLMELNTNSDNTYHLRGLLGGVMSIIEQMSGIEDFTFFDNLDDSGDRFVKFNTKDHYSSSGNDSFLINCTAWEI